MAQQQTSALCAHESIISEEKTAFPPDIIRILESHGVDPTETTAAINLLTELGVATVEETEDQIIIVYNQEQVGIDGSAQQADENDGQFDNQLLASGLTPVDNVLKVEARPCLQNLHSTPSDEQQLENSVRSFADPSVLPTSKTTESGVTSARTSAEGLQQPCQVPAVPDDLPREALKISSPPQLPSRSGENKENVSGTSESESGDFSGLTPNTLKRILNETETGKNIIRQAEKGALSDRRQLELAEVIANWHLAHRTRVHESDLRDYSRVIVLLFRNENQSSYFLPRGGEKRNPGGKIANKINTLKNKSRKRKVQDAEYEKSLKDKNYLQQEIGGPSCTSRDALDWLTINDSPWTTVLDKWRASFPVRSAILEKPNAINELKKLKLWNLIKSENGHQLLDIDFCQLKLNPTNQITSWAEVFPVIGRYLSRRSIDETSEHLIGVLASNSATDDMRICVLLLLLNTVLHPQKVTTSYKPTVVNGREDTILFADSNSDADMKVQNLYKVYEQLGIPIAPKLVFFGQPTDLKGEFRVYYHDFYYSFSSAQRAIDVYIKFTKVLSIKHSKISKLVWLFVARYFYGLKVNERYASIDRLEDFLNTSLGKTGNQNAN